MNLKFSHKPNRRHCHSSIFNALNLMFVVLLLFISSAVIICLNVFFFFSSDFIGHNFGFETTKI